MPAKLKSKNYSEMLEETVQRAKEMAVPLMIQSISLMF